ncbi:hypothetical protein R1sor_000128 [Riccia sorocarpa]|uniref:Uncharacterized protein n=1 Tax=Riccia sorocarpa TaxID=122646 RepID=A0ABD3GWE0_9MARC
MGITLDVRSCLCAFAFAFLLLFVDVSEQRTVRGEEGNFLMEQFRPKEERLFRPPALLEDLQVPEGQLQPPFSSNTFEYNVTVSDDVEIIQRHRQIGPWKGEGVLPGFQLTESSLCLDYAL